MRAIVLAMKLAEYLQQENMTQTAFAKKAGLPIPRVNEWIKGKGRPTLDGLAAVVKATGGAVGLADFVSMENE